MRPDRWFIPTSIVLSYMLGLLLTMPAAAQSGWKVLLRSGQANESLPGVVFSDLDPDLGPLSDGGRILLSGRAEGVRGLYRFEKEQLRLVAREYDPAPGHPGLVFPGPSDQSRSVILAADDSFEVSGSLIDPRCVEQ